MHKVNVRKTTFSLLHSNQWQPTFEQGHQIHFPWLKKKTCLSLVSCYKPLKAIFICK